MIKKFDKMGFTLDGQKYEMTCKPKTYGSGNRAYQRKGTAFVEGGDDLDQSPIENAAKKAGAPSIYTDRGKHLEVDSAWDSHNALVVAIKERILRAAMILCCDDMSALRIRFTRKAGCSCSCSPGFIIEGVGPVSINISEVKGK